MTSVTTVRDERAALADEFAATEPDAPTLCDGWGAAELAAHLVVREHRPIASLGIIVAPLGGLHDRAIVRTVQRLGYDQTVSRFRDGPPLLWKPLDAKVNLIELFVHHEDLRRGRGDHTPRPADEIADLEDDLWAALGGAAKLLARRLKPMGLELVRDDGETQRIRSGQPELTVTGRPGEIVLWLYGRKDAAGVEFGGDPEAVQRARTTDLGI